MMGAQTPPSLAALTQATALVAEGLSEDRLLPLLARCAAEASAADLAAIYLQSEHGARAKAEWYLGGHWGGDPEVLAGLPAAYGQGGGVLTPLFRSTGVVWETDLL